jgi:hypothetical protein
MNGWMTGPSSCTTTKLAIPSVAIGILLTVWIEKGILGCIGKCGWIFLAVNQAQSM